MIGKDSPYELIYNHFDEAVAVMSDSKTLAPEILEAAVLISTALKLGNKVMWCGNGGSAADSQHLAAELVGRYKLERKALASLALTTDTSVITAISNDFGFDHVFERQIQALGKPGDVLVALSTSGKSTSILKALNMAKSVGISTVLFSSIQAINVAADIQVLVNSIKTEQIQHGHIAIGHALCELVEKELFQSLNGKTT
jgi:D-sedoheptulose 7-phosphate isomerase